MNQNEHIVTLIAKQLQGLATPQEAEELQQWLQADASRRQEYDDMVLIWQKSGPLLANPQFNADIAWAKLDDKVAKLNGRPKEPFHNVISFLFSSTKKIAAAVVILALVTLGGYWWYKQAQWQTFTATNKNETITLPDQSVVLVRKGSSIKYLKSFDGKERRVHLNGEAFFTVQRNEAKPFLVITDNADVKVLGTSFLVSAYEVEVNVVVVTGKVNVTYKYTVESNNQITLNKGQQALLFRGRFHQSPVTDSNFMAWNTGQLVFNNTALPKVLEDISHYYGSRVELDPALQTEAAAIHITVEFKDQPLEQALEEIRLITGLALKKEKDKAVFYRK
jgi:ferric-dicitrate binding protein FerR (iron transport regulator)